MTLNITVLSPAAIHQSADFCISETERDDQGNWITISQNQSKIVALSYANWNGVLTYCGIGSWNGRHTEEYVADWIDGLMPESTFHEFLERIRSNGSDWLSTISSVLQRPVVHTFVLAAFIDKACQYAVISNYQSLSGRTSLEDRLFVDSGTTNSIHVLVTGSDDAVSEEDRRLLARLAADERDFRVLRHHMAGVNARAARSPVAKNGISEACIVYSTARSGGQWSEVHGPTSGPVTPNLIFGGISVGRMMDEVFRNLDIPRGTIVQTASATSRSSSDEANERIACQPRFLSGFDDPEKAPIAHVKEIGDLNQICIDLRSVNNNGGIVGNARIIPNQTPRAFVWNENASLSELAILGSALGYASDINDDGEVVGWIDVGNGNMRAFYRTQSTELLDLGSLGRKSSVALCINSRHEVVGNLQSGTRDIPERAFIWRPGTAISELFPETEGWLRAYQITAGGSIIGWRGKAENDCRGYIWTSADGMTELLTDEGRPFYICAINESGVAVGEADDSRGVRRPFVWTRRGGLTGLQVTNRFHPADIDSGGNIVGNVSGSGVPLSRPYIYTAGGEFLPLPFVEEHATDAVAINDNGVIIGSARSHSWKHVHPLVWRLMNIARLRE
jgi:probable HAF family extracellular repeat protein